MSMKLAGMWLLLAAPWCPALRSADLLPVFDVASVKLGEPDGFPVGTLHRPGRISFTNRRMIDLLEEAYNLKPFQIVGPEWINAGDSLHSPYRYYVEGRYPPGTDPSQVRLMIQALLAQRFQLAVHLTRQVAPVYDLVLDQDGNDKQGKPKLRPADETVVNPMTSSTVGHIVTPRISVLQFAQLLSGLMDRPVIDRTGIPGEYSIQLDWSPDDRDTASLQSWPSIFTAVRRQLGLRLIPTRAPVEMLVVDRVEKTPIEN